MHLKQFAAANFRKLRNSLFTFSAVFGIFAFPMIPCIASQSEFGGGIKLLEKFTQETPKIAQDVKLSSALSRPALFSTEPSISRNGDQVYLYYANQDPGQLIAELFDNVHGTLQSVQQLFLDPNFPVPWDGFASPDFKRFSIVESTFTNTPDNARIRILDKNFNVLASRTFTITFGGNGNGGILGGTFSEDGKYVLVHYIINTNQPDTSTVLLVLKVSDLSTVASKTIKGFDINSAEFLTIKGKGRHDSGLFISFQSSQGQFLDETTTLPPFYSQVYQVHLNKGTISLVDQAPLPKFAEKSVVSKKRFGLIAHGGFCSLFPNQLSIYDTNFLKTTALPHDNSESRVLLFDGKKLHLVIKQPVNCCNRTVIYPPGNGYSFIIGQNRVININGDPNNQATDTEFWCLAQLNPCKRTPSYKPNTLPFQDMNRGIPIFSEDGKWLLRTGSYGFFNGDPDHDAIGIHNVLLFKVHSEELHK